MTDITPMQKMLEDVQMDDGLLGERLSAALEYMTYQAALAGPYYLNTDGDEAIVVFAVGDAATALREVMPEGFESFEDRAKQAAESDDFLTDTYPGDEQPDDDQMTLFEDTDNG